MEITKVDIGRIVPYQGNAKQHPREQIEQIKKSIMEFGNNDPIAVDEDMVVIEGHGRLEALKELGMAQAEVIVLSGLTDEQKAAYRLVHNQLTMNTGFDLKALEEELDRIKGIDMEALGFDLSEIEAELSKMEDEAKEAEDDGFDAVAAAEEIEEPVTKLGDVWLMGDHALLCGDSTDPRNLRKVVEAVGGRGALADLVLTDPPYNVAYEGGTEEGLTIENDDMPPAEFEEFLEKAFKAMDGVLKPGGAFYVWHASRTSGQFLEALSNAGMEVRQQLIWVKNALVLSRQDYQWKHEPCFYGWKEGAAHWFTDSRTETTVLEFDKPLRNGDHPTMKPVPLFGYLAKNSSQRGQIVLDPFCGSGTTVVACEQLSRKAAGMELDPRYCDVIVKRWEALTGRKAELLEG